MSQVKIKKTCGRPVASCGADMRDKFLDVAVTLFSRQGAAATTTAQIAAEVGVTPAMAHYYFKNREQLFEAVARERMLCFIDYVWEGFPQEEGELPLRAAHLKSLVRRIVEGAERMPWMPGLWVREMITESAVLRGLVLEYVKGVPLRAFTLRLKAGQRLGCINPALEPLLSILSILGVTLLPLSLLSVWAEPGEEQLARERVVRHAEEILLPGFAFKGEAVSLPPGSAAGQK